MEERSTQVPAGFLVGFLLHVFQLLFILPGYLQRSLGCSSEFVQQFFGFFWYHQFGSHTCRAVAGMGTIVYSIYHQGFRTMVGASTATCG